VEPFGVEMRHEGMATQRTRRMTMQAQEELRFRVVRAIVDQKLSRAEACRTFGVGKTSVWRWMKAYRSGGERRLKSRKRGRKKRSSLKGYQAATIVRMITDRCPDQLKLPFALWTRDAVRQLIEERWGKRLSVWTVGRYLRKWGFTPQKPLRRAYEQNPTAVKRWLEEEYPAVARRAKRDNAEIHWGDEMGLRSDHQAGTSYGPKGNTPIIPGTGQRFRCNMISTITNRGQLAFMVFKERFTADVMIEFLRRLLRHANRKVCLIHDRHPVHRSRKVTRWIDARPDQIERVFLPGYSPELNPDELLNQDVKTNAHGRQRPQDQQAMLTNVRSYLRSTQKQPHVVKRYFDEEHVRYAAEPA
jgi:transposase